MSNRNWAAVDSIRDFRTFRNEEYLLTLFPSVKDDLWHVIVESETEITLRSMFTKSAIKTIYGIEL